MVDCALKIDHPFCSQSGGHAALAIFFFFFFFKSGEFLLHIPCCFHFYAASFSYTSRTGFIFIWRVQSLTHPVLPSWLSQFHVMIRGEFLSLTHHMLASFLCGEFPSHISCWLRFLSGESFLLYIPCLASFSIRLGSFSLLHIPCRIPCWLHLYLGTFSYTSHAGFILIWGVSLDIPCRL